MNNIIQLPKNLSLEEWKGFSEKQLLTIQFLRDANEKLEEEIKELKRTLNSSKGQSPVEKIIVSPEQALLEDQILMIQQRAYMKELNLEDVKKLDILLKHNRQLKNDSKLLEGKSKPITLSNEDLLRIAQGNSNESE